MRPHDIKYRPYSMEMIFSVTVLFGDVNVLAHMITEDGAHSMLIGGTDFP